MGICVTLAVAAYCRRQSAFNGPVPLPTQCLSALPILVTRVLWNCGWRALPVVNIWSKVGILEVSSGRG